MDKNMSISLAKIGMNRDVSTDSLDNKSYTIAMNMNMENSSGDLLKLKSEPSNVLANKFTSGYKVVGFENDINSNRTYYFLTNPTTGVSEFGYVKNIENTTNSIDIEVECEDCDFKNILSEPLENTNQVPYQEYVTLLEDSCNKCLNLSIYYPIKKIVIKTEKAGAKIFFSDNYNPPRYIDMRDLSIYKETGKNSCGEDNTKNTCLDCDKLRLFPKTTPIRITPKSLVLGGRLPLGQYSFYAAYSDRLGNPMSEYTSLTNPVSVFDSNNVIQSEVEKQELTNYAIRLEAEVVDKDRMYYKVIVAYTNVVDQGVRYFEVGEYSTDTKDIIFDTIQNKKEISIDNILIPRSNVELIGGLSTAGNYLFGQGITRTKEWNLQPVVNLMGGFFKWQTHVAREDIYQEGVDVSKFKGYMRDEAYPLAIEFLTNEGYRTARFPLIGRPATEEDLEIVYLEGSEINTLDTESINSSLDNCEASTRSKKFQYYNTASFTGICGNEGLATTTITEPVTKICRDKEIVVTEGGIFTIKTPGVFTTLKDFINTVVEDGGCLKGTCEDPDDEQEYPFCVYTQANCYEPCDPGFENCDEPILERQFLEVNEIKGQGPNGKEVITIEYLDFPEAYSKLRLGNVCHPHKREATGNFERAFEFEKKYIGDDISAYQVVVERIENSYNTSPLYAEELEMVSSVNQELMFGYYHMFEEYKVESDAKLNDFITPCTQTDQFQVLGGQAPLYDIVTYTRKFLDRLHKESLWFKVQDANLEETFIFEITKLVRDELTKGFVVFNDKLRVSVYDSSNGGTAIYCKIIKLQSEGLQLYFDIDVDQDTLVIKETSNDAGTTAISIPDKIYIAIDAPIVESEGSEQNAVFSMPIRGCFGAAIRPREIDKITAEYDSISFDKVEKYVADCEFEVPIITECGAVPYEFGEFAYVESEAIYPDNQELYNSRRLEINQEDFDDEELALEFEEKYSRGVNSDGKYYLKKETNFSCKKIRHFKFPDNKVSPFIYDKPQAGFTKTIVYPIGVTVNEKVINKFLNIAVNNGLITKDQRDSIVGYEIFRGDRTLNKSVIAKGLLYDMYTYKEENKEVLFPNFPYNALGDNQLILDDTRKENIKHIDNSESNYNFTFNSPDTDYYRPTLPSEMKVEGYMFGRSKGVFEDVKDHPKYVILGRKGRRLASTLATAEVIAEATVASMQAFSNYTQTIGFTNTVFSGAWVASPTIAVALGLVGALFKYGRYKYQWLNTFRDLGTAENFASYYTSVGEYNYLRTIQDKGNEIRSVLKSNYLTPGRFNIVNEVDGERLEINNVDREKSVFINLGRDFSIVYPEEYKDYDNVNENPIVSSRFTSSLTYDCAKGRSKEFIKNIASPYVALKVYLPEQYGSINNINWLTTSHYGDLNNPKTGCLPIFGGDIFISRHTLKRKAPLFLDSAMGLASRQPFNYKSYSNYGKEPRYYANFMSPDEIEVDRGLPDIRTEYKFDCLTGSMDFYVKSPSKFYLYYYGIPSFMVESTVNTNFRIAKPEPRNSFYPLYGDYVDWTQETNVSIKETNKYLYNKAYSSNTLRSIGRTLPDTYNKELFDTLYDSPNGMMFSLPDNNENDLNEPWLVFRPLDMHEFPTSYGKLIEVAGIEGDSIMARFESTLSVLNVVDSIIDDGSAPEVQGLGVGLRRRPITFTHTDLGYEGTQSFQMVSNEFGHFWVDAKRGQVFHKPPGGNSRPIEISSRLGDRPSGMKNWFKNQLPFKVKSNLVEGSEAIDIDNPYNGIGISMGWDSRFKRVFITKKDYKPLKPVVACGNKFYKTEGNEEIIQQYIDDGYEYEGIKDCKLSFFKEVEGTTTTCIESLKFIVAYREFGNIEGDPNPPACYGGHTCNRAVFNITANDIIIGTVSLNNAGGPMDLENRIPGYPNYIGQSVKDRYSEFTIDAETAEILSQSSSDGSITLKFECAACEGLEDCPPGTCHQDVSWMRIYKDGEEIYNGCPEGNILSDFIPCEDSVEIIKEYTTEPLTEVSLINTEFFEEVSWTVAYSMVSNSWISYYNFTPNYYVGHNNYFQTGINTSSEELKIGVWSHLVTNKSYGVFYGEKYEIGFEYPIPNNYTSQTLNTLELWTEALRYHNDYDISYDRNLNFNKMVISNHRETTGNLELVPQKTLRDNSRYPKTKGDTQEILMTNSNDRWHINYLYNRVNREDSNQPIWNWDINKINKKLNTKAFKFKGKRVLERMKGDYFLVKLGYDLDSRFEISFKWATAKESFK